MGQITNGVDKIEITEVGTEDWRILGYTSIDTAAVSEEEGTTTDFNVEELDTPLFSRFTPGKTTIAWDIADPSLPAFVEVFGGTITGIGDAAQWNAPASYVQKEFRVRITPKIGYMMLFNRMLFKPLKNFTLGKNNLTAITVNADMLQPTDGVTPALVLGGLVEGGGSTGTLTPQTITFAALSAMNVDDDVTVAPTASSGLPVTLMSTDPSVATVDGLTITAVSDGTCDIVATQNGNTMYAPAPPVVQTLVVNP